MFPAQDKKLAEASFCFLMHVLRPAGLLHGIAIATLPTFCGSNVATNIGPVPSVHVPHFHESSVFVACLYVRLVVWQRITIVSLCLLPFLSTPSL